MNFFSGMSASKSRRPGSLVAKVPANKSKNVVDDTVAMIDEQLANNNIATLEDTHSVGGQESVSSNHSFDKAGPKVMRRISETLKNRRKSEENVAVEVAKLNSKSTDVVHIACLKGDFLRVSDLLTKNPSLLNQTYNFSDKPLLSEAEDNDATYLPPPQIPKTIKAALNVIDPSRMTRDQRWLIQNSFGRSSLLHYACAGDRIEVVKYLLDLGIDVSLTNDSKKPAEFYTISDEIKELIVSEKRRLMAANRPQNKRSSEVTAGEGGGGAQKLLLARNAIAMVLQPPPAAKATAAKAPPPPPAPKASPPAVVAATPPRPPPRPPQGLPAVDSSGVDLSDPKYERFVKMKRILPEAAVQQKMYLEGFTPAEIEAFFNHYDSTVASRPISTASSRQSVTNNNNSNNNNNANTNGPGRLPPPPPVITPVLRPKSEEMSESGVEGGGEGGATGGERRNSKRLTTRRMSRVMNSRRMSDSNNNNPTSTGERLSSSAVSDLTHETAEQQQQHHHLQQKPGVMPRAPPPPPGNTAAAQLAAQLASRISKRNLDSNKGTDSVADSTGSGSNTNNNNNNRASAKMGKTPAASTAAPPPPPPAIAQSPAPPKGTGNRPPPPPGPPVSSPSPTTPTTPAAAAAAIPLAINRPPLAMKRLSIVGDGNELRSMLTEKEANGGTRITERYEGLDSSEMEDREKDQSPERNGEAERKQTGEPGTTATSNNSIQGSKVPAIVHRRRSLLEEKDSILPENPFTMEKIREAVHQKEKQMKEAERELTKEEKMKLHFSNMEKMLLKLAPLEDVASRVLLENTDNQEAMVKKIIDNPSHYLNQLSSTITHIKHDHHLHHLPGGSSPQTILADRPTASPQSAPGLTPALTNNPGTLRNKLLLSTASSTAGSPRSAARDKKLLSNHMIPTTISLNNTNKEGGGHHHHAHSAAEAGTFREKLWRKAADYMNRGVFDSTGPEFNQLRSEAYELGNKIIHQEFKSFANKDNWESVDLVQMKAIQTILSLKQNMDAQQGRKSRHQSKKYLSAGGDGALGSQSSSASSNRNSSSGKKISFDDLFEGHATSTGKKKAANFLQHSPGDAGTGEGEEEEGYFDEHYYQYDIEEELEKLRERFDANDLAAFDQHRSPSQQQREEERERNSSNNSLENIDMQPDEGNPYHSGGRYPASSFPVIPE